MQAIQKVNLIVGTIADRSENDLSETRVEIRDDRLWFQIESFEFEMMPDEVAALGSALSEIAPLVAHWNKPTGGAN